MARKKKQVKRVHHKWTRKIKHWFYCDGCGLVALRNEATERRIREGCDTDDEPIKDLQDF